MSFWGQTNLISPFSFVQEEMLLFHDHAMSLMLFVFTFVVIMGTRMVISSYCSRTLIEAQMLESIWTIVPALVLIMLAFPSMRLLYLLDDSTNTLPFKVIARQWYWSYESSTNETMDSYMDKNSLLRLLEVDQYPIVNQGVKHTALITSSDVIHSYTIPALGIKVDAVPGRLNSASFTVMYPGIMYGQCSEICGVNHSFMPIVLGCI